MDFDVKDLERLLPRTEQRRGRGRKCRLTQWLEQHHTEFGRLVARGGHTWKQMAEGLTQLGLMNGDGRPLTGERLRKGWAEVDKTHGIQPLQRNAVQVVISPSERLSLDPTRTDDQHNTNDPLFASLEAELVKVEAATGSKRFLMVAGLLEVKLEDFRRGHKGLPTFEVVTKFTDESISRLNRVREDYYQNNPLQEDLESPPGRNSPAAGSGSPSQPVQEGLAPPPVRHSPTAGSGLPSRPLPESAVLKTTDRQTREEFEALRPKIDWEKHQTKLAELVSELRLLKRFTPAFREKERDFEAVLVGIWRAVGSSHHYEEDLKVAESFAGHLEDALGHVNFTTAKMRLDVVQEQIEWARSFTKEWRVRLHDINFPLPTDWYTAAPTLMLGEQPAN